MFIFTSLQGEAHGSETVKFQLLLKISHPSAECKFQGLPFSPVFGCQYWKAFHVWWVLKTFINENDFVP